MIKGAGLELGAQQAPCPEPDPVGRGQMLGDPTLMPIHSASEEAPLGNLGPQSCGQGTCSHSQPSELTLC